MSTVISPNMNLPVPIVGVELGPEYATDVNNSLNIIDAHDHTPGNGVQLTPNSLNINTDLPMNNRSLTGTNSVVFQPAASPSSTNGSLSESGVDLYYTDGNGNQIQMTTGGSIAGATGSIAGLSAPATATYVSGSQTFVWESDVNTAANMDAGSLILRNLTASSNGVTIAPPSALASNYTVTLPALPASQKIMTLDASGNLAAPYVVDNSTITISTGTIGVPAGGITTTQIANDTIINANVNSAAAIAYSKLALTNAIVNADINSAAAIGLTKLAVPTTNTTTSSGVSGVATPSTNFQTITNCTATLTGIGRPVLINFVSQTSASPAFFFVNGTGVFNFRVIDTVTSAIITSGSFQVGTVSTTVPVSVFNCMDVRLVSGTITYALQCAASNVSSTVNNCQMVTVQL